MANQNQTLVRMDRATHERLKELAKPQTVAAYLRDLSAKKSVVADELKVLQTEILKVYSDLTLLAQTVADNNPKIHNLFELHLKAITKANDNFERTARTQQALNETVAKRLLDHQDQLDAASMHTSLLQKKLEDKGILTRQESQEVCEKIVPEVLKWRKSLGEVKNGPVKA